MCGCGRLLLLPHAAGGILPASQPSSQQEDYDSRMVKGNFERRKELAERAFKINELCEKEERKQEREEKRHWAD